MNPADFVSLALRLAANPGEAERRSAVSRAYYGAFHKARQLLESCGIRFTTTGETHEKLPYCLEAAQVDELELMSSWLKLLRRSRNAADYKLADSRFENSEFITRQVKVAIDVVSCAARFENELATIETPIRDYARNVLR